MQTGTGGGSGGVTLDDPASSAFLLPRCLEGELGLHDLWLLADQLRYAHVIEGSQSVQSGGPMLLPLCIVVDVLHQRCEKLGLRHRLHIREVEATARAAEALLS
jgi:hypothetical protein